MATASPNFAAESPRRGPLIGRLRLGRRCRRRRHSLDRNARRHDAVHVADRSPWLVTRLPRRDTLIPAFYNIGVLSLPVIALTGTFIGMVLAVQSYTQFKQFGFETRLGALINLSMCRELGPVLAATMLAGRVGSAIAAEVGTMRVTEQIDALTSMGANPIHYLVVPRFLGCLLMIPSLTIMAIFMGVVGGWLYSVQVFGIDSYHYWHNSQQFVHNWDLVLRHFQKRVFRRDDRDCELLPRLSTARRGRKASAGPPPRRLCCRSSSS